MANNNSSRKSMNGLDNNSINSNNINITENLDMNNYRIVDLANGVDSADAVNVGQIAGIATNTTRIISIENSCNIYEASINAFDLTSVETSLNFLDLSGVQFALAISNNTNNISTNASAISTANTNISNNATAISTANTNISNNATAIATNTSNIQTNSNVLVSVANDINKIEASCNIYEASINAISFTNIENSLNFLELSGNVFALDIANIELSCNVYEASINAITGSPWTTGTDGAGDPQLQYDAGSIKVDGGGGGGIGAYMGVALGGASTTASFGNSNVFDNQPLNIGLEQTANGSTLIRCGLTSGVHQFITFYGNNNSQRMVIRGDGGGVGIGVTTPTFPLEISGYKVNGGSFRWVFFKNVSPSTGTTHVSPLSGPTSTSGAHSQNRMSVSASHGYLTNTGYLQASDDRIKSFEKPIEVGLKEILQLEPKHYLKHPTILVDADDETGETLPKDEEGRLFQMTEDGEKEPLDCDFELGLISQAVEKIKGLEILVTEEYNGIKNVNYVGLIPVLVKAIQEMEAKRKEDNKKFIDLNKRLLILENKLKNIESTDKEYIL